MKAEMNASGVITLRPESDIETFALSHWMTKNFVQEADLKLGESGHWRASGLVVGIHKNGPPLER